jgi:hypothetical protein
MSILFSDCNCVGSERFCRPGFRLAIAIGASCSGAVDMEVDGEEEACFPSEFEGASGSVDDVLEVPKRTHTCEVCSAKFPHWDHFAYCGKKSGNVVKHQDWGLTQAKHQALGQGPSNLATGSTGSEGLVLTCVLCCEKKMQKVYTVKKGEGFTVKSAWKTIARRTKPNMKVPTSKLLHCMQRLEDRLNRDGAGVDGMPVDIHYAYKVVDSL